MKRTLLFFVATIVASCCVVPALSSADESGARSADRTAALHGIFGTYDAAPRKRDGHVDIEQLLADLQDLRANTYHWLIWRRASDWDDLHKFLPAARRKGILVWAGLVPPSESPPHTSNYSEPFRLDYERWAAEFAKLSLREPNLVAWSIDDFTHNLRFFNPDYLHKVIAGARRINPKLAFVPCSYSPRITKQFAARYKGLVDGILFPYRAELTGANLTDPTRVESEVTTLRKILGPDFPIILDVYATAHSHLGKSTPAYVREVMSRGIRCADGVLVYCHQHPDSNAEKYGILKKLFHRWAADPELPKPKRP